MSGSIHLVRRLHASVSTEEIRDATAQVACEVSITRHPSRAYTAPLHRAVHPTARSLQRTLDGRAVIASERAPIEAT